MVMCLSSVNMSGSYGVKVMNTYGNVKVLMIILKKSLMPFQQYFIYIMTYLAMSQGGRNNRDI